MKLIDSFSPNSPPIGSGPRGEVVHLPPLMDSLSCVSCLRDYEKNHGEEAGEILSAVEVPARNFFPLTPDLKGFFDNPRQEAVLAQPKRKSTASLTDDRTLIVEKKEKKEAPECEERGEGCNGVSTELALLYDPYKIKKKLTKSDLGQLSRLLIPQLGVKSHLLPCMSKGLVKRVKSSKGAEVVVWDADMRSEHRLVFAFWEKSQSYVLKGSWNKEFVPRRGLANGDEIGIYWDPIASRSLRGVVDPPQDPPTSSHGNAG